MDGPRCRSSGEINGPKENKEQEMWIYYSDVAEMQDDRGRFYEKHGENMWQVEA